MTTMTVDSLDSFGQLAKAIGLLGPSGQPNASWFGDPVGSTSNNNGLKHLLADDAQRTALLGFVDEILGPPDKAVRSGKIWVPLFSEADPRITISVVVEEVAGKVHLGIGVEHTTSGGPPTVSTRVHVPVFRFARRGGSALTGSGGMPGWLMIGTPGARVGISVDATFTETAPPPGEAALAGMSLGLGIPTSPGDQLSVDFELRGLQLPGATEPRDFGFDAGSLAELGTDVFDLVLGLVRAQADALSGIDPALAPFRAVAGLVGLRNVSGLPALPLADIPVQGVAALTGWVEQVLADNNARDAWLGQLADLVGGTVLPADDAVRFTVGPATIRIGVRVQPGAAGHPILVPWVELSLDTRSGARARLVADLLRADTGTGRCTALPELRAEAVFGSDAGGAALLDSGFPHVGSLHAGVALDPTGRPAFVLTLHDVQVTGGSPQHAVLDLSSPSAALDSASTVLEGALADAIDDLGPAGALVNRLLGLTPPAGIDPLDVPLLFTDPLAAVRAYWLDLTGSPTAAADVLGRLRALITDAAVGLVPGTGTAVDPWRVELVEGVELRVWRDGSRLLADLVGSVTTAVLGDYEVTAALGITLLRADLAAGTAAFAVEAHGTLSFGRQDDEPSRIAVGSVELEAGDFTLRTSWIPGRGLRATIAAEDLAVVISGETRVPLPLPTLDSDGNLVLPTLDWSAIEIGLAGLLGEVRLPVVDALLDLVGWRGSGAHLSLEGLVGADPGAAVLQWLTDLVLDCERVRWALGPVAALLSGFRRTVPMGSGTARNPFRCPVAGEPRAPGLAVWMDPGCPGGYDELLQRLGALTSGEQPEPAAIAGVLRGAATALPDVADLMVGRDSLAEGFGLLLERWTGTDGLVGRPSALPDGVTDVELPGFSYDELVALGSAGLLVGDVLDPPPSAVVHVGAEPTWTRDRPPVPPSICTAPRPRGRCRRPEAVPGSSGCPAQAPSASRRRACSPSSPDGPTRWC